MITVSSGTKHPVGRYGAAMDEHHQGADDGEGQELPETDPQGRPYIGAPRITQTTRSRLVSRTCAWCGTPVPYSGKGRPPTYCSKAHRTRSWEVRTALARQDRDRQAGAARGEEEPLREVIRETVTRTATRSARVEVPVPGQVQQVVVERPARPEKAWEVCAVLSQAQMAVREGLIAEHDYDRLSFAAHALIRAIEEQQHQG